MPGLHKVTSNQLARHSAILSLLLLLAGCAATPGQESATPDAAAGNPTQANEAASPAAVPLPEPEEIEYGNFTEDQLYQALISEIGGQRGQMEQAGDNYLDLAMATRDLNVIRRAVQFASANGDTNALLQLGLLWSEVSPGDAQPHLMLSFEFLESGNFDQALSHMARVIDLGGSMDFSALAARTGQLEPQARSRLITSLRELQNEFSEEPSIQMALIQLLAQNGEYQEALSAMRELEEQSDVTPMLVRLEAQILQSAEEPEEALRVLRAGVRDFPEDRDIRLSYARMLVQFERFPDAREQFQELVERDTRDWGTWYSMALLDMELENYDSAARIFQRLIAVDQRADESQYYLGFIYQEQGDLSRAIEHLRQVRIGTNNYMAAQQQATRLAIELGELDDAHAWLVSQSRGQPRLEVLFTTVESSLLIQAGHIDRAQSLLDNALNKYPNDTDLLFARVLLHDNTGNMAGSERDLRQIIRMQPDDSRALNHLGYMLADQTERYEEALVLIEQAINLSPNDPAIIDSLGWVQYKLGRYEDALRNLRRAYAAFPDPEVASHLGEVLWQMERREEAVDIWEGSLNANPDSELIEEVMDRFLTDR